MRATTKRAGLSKRTCAIALVMMCLLSAIPAQTAYAAGNPLTLTVGQVFTSSSASAEDTFTYKLQPLAGSQMSGGSSVDYTFTIDGTKTGDDLLTTPYWVAIYVSGAIVLGCLLLIARKRRANSKPNK